LAGLRTSFVFYTWPNGHPATPSYPLKRVQFGCAYFPSATRRIDEIHWSEGSLVTSPGHMLIRAYQKKLVPVELARV
jgi:hypothetical protein